MHAKYTYFKLFLRSYKPKMKKKYLIRAGSDIFQTGVGTTYKIKDLRNHPKYDNTLTDFDATVVRIYGHFDGPNMTPISLSKVSADSIIGHEALVSGFGFTKVPPTMIAVYFNRMFYI